jgi:hypothetical protein
MHAENSVLLDLAFFTYSRQNKPGAHNYPGNVTPGGEMPVVEEAVRKELVVLAVACDNLRGKVEEVRSRLGDDFPPTMISREDPPSVVFNADATLETIADELDDLTAQLRFAAEISPEKLYALWMRETA